MSKVKNSKGEFLWLFNFLPEGFNDVWAKTKAQAIKKAKTEFSFPVKEDSFRTCTQKEADDQNRSGWSLFN